jgi:hypothetical protein
MTNGGVSRGLNQCGLPPVGVPANGLGFSPSDGRPNDDKAGSMLTGDDINVDIEAGATLSR